jgi:hypothetical protein
VKRLAAALLSIALTASPAAAVTDRFSSSDLSGYVTGGAPGWYVEWGRLAHTYGSKVGFVELVRRTDLKKVEADLTLSPERSNAGLTVLWKNHRNHLWAKLEITPGNPNGLMTIGRRRGGRVKSLLARSRGGLKAGETYHVELGVVGRTATFTVTGVTASFSRAISYRLSAEDQAAFGEGAHAGVRAKYLYDEDDGGTRWDNLSV